MRTIKAVLEYEGARYHGWQRQDNVLSVQEVVERALCKITRINTTVIASGRTDAGVHARGQVVSFTISSEIEEWKLQKALNALLPFDIVVTRLESVRSGFHARYAAKGKIYIYTILNRTYPSAFKHRSSWLIMKPLDLEQMKRGAESLAGEHDFSSFRSSACCARTTVRVIEAIDIWKEADEIFFSIGGSGFLKQMVRNIVGTLVEVGLGRISAEDIERILSGRDRRLAGPTAPPQGLCLLKVIY